VVCGLDVGDGDGDGDAEAPARNAGQDCAVQPLSASPPINRTGNTATMRRRLDRLPGVA
jgi:hypothetical protein